MYHILPYTITHHPPSLHNYITHHHPTYPPHTLYNKHINCTSGNALSLRNRAEILFRA